MAWEFLVEMWTTMGKNALLLKNKSLALTAGSSVH